MTTTTHISKALSTRQTDIQVRGDVCRIIYCGEAKLLLVESNLQLYNNHLYMFQDYARAKEYKHMVVVSYSDASEPACHHLERREQLELEDGHYHGALLLRTHATECRQQNPQSVLNTLGSPSHSTVRRLSEQYRLFLNSTPKVPEVCFLHSYKTQPLQVQEWNR